jgi:hypothetical protein
MTGRDWLTIGLGALIGVPVSLATSWAFWWFLTFKVVPSASAGPLQRRDELATLPGGTTRTLSRYWILITNTGKRAFVEPKIQITYMETLLTPSGQPERTILDVPVSNTKIMNLEPGDERRLELFTHLMSETAYRKLGPELSGMLQDRSPGAIERLLDETRRPLGTVTDRTLLVEIVANDGKSGTRRYIPVADPDISLEELIEDLGTGPTAP